MLRKHLHKFHTSATYSSNAGTLQDNELETVSTYRSSMGLPNPFTWSPHCHRRWGTGWRLSNTKSPYSQSLSIRTTFLPDSGVFSITHKCIRSIKQIFLIFLFFYFLFVFLFFFFFLFLFLSFSYFFMKFSHAHKPLSL